MNLTRVRRTDWLAGIGGLVLLGSLWLKWYGFDLSRGDLQLLTDRVPEITAWQAFSYTDILLTLFALLAIGVPVSSALAHRPAKPVAFTVLASCGGIIAVLLVLYRIVNQPGSNDVVTVKLGAWIGLVGAILTLVGSWLAMADESAPGIAPPQVPVRAAP